MKYTPEPWHHERIDEVNGHISYDLWGGPSLSSGQTLIGNVGFREHDERPSKNDADRIVACVNAMAGVEDPAAFVSAVRSLVASDEPLDRHGLNRAVDAKAMRELKARGGGEA